MQSKSGCAPRTHFPARSKKLITTETRKLLDQLATGLLFLALALGVILVALSVGAWWNDTQPIFSISALKAALPSTDGNA